MARNKEAIKQFDFIRAVACIGIVLYHFSVESGWFNIIRVIYLLGISGAGIDADSQVEKPMRLQVKE